MTVDDTKVLAGIMDELGIEYKILDDQKADVYSELTFSELAARFAEKKCNIIKMEEHDESLEAFYLALVGGNSACTD